MSWRWALALIGVLGCLAVAGCGGGSDDEPRVAPATDESDRIAALEKRKERLQKRLARKRQLEKEQARTKPEGSSVEADRMLAALPGSAGLVAGPAGTAGPNLSAGSLSIGDAWSTIKVPIAQRVLADAGGPDGLGSGELDQINRAITLSDNEAAAALFRDLEGTYGGLAGASRAVEEVLREAGDNETVVSTVGRDGFSTYGQTDWSLSNQYRYMAALAGGCTGDAASRDYLLGQMAAVGGSDTFGLGAAGYPARWKGGWGPGTDGRYLVRQMGVIEVAGKEVVLAMAAIPDDGSFETGQSMLSQIAGWTADHLAGQVSGPSGC